MAAASTRQPDASPSESQQTHPQPQSPQSQSKPQQHDNTNDNQPASPPLPQPHKPITPGYRAERVQILYSKSLDRVLSKLAWDNFRGCYPTIATKADGVLKQVQAQMVDKLKEKCEKEFENIMTSRQVVLKINELEKLAEEASERRKMALREQQDSMPTPPHLLPPSTILQAHLHPSLAAHQSQLNARLQTTQSQNSLLFEHVHRQREEIDELLRQLESAVGDVEGANNVLGGLMDELSKEAREAEADIERAGGR